MLEVDNYFQQEDSTLSFY